MLRLSDYILEQDASGQAHFQHYVRKMHMHKAVADALHQVAKGVRDVRVKRSMQHDVKRKQRLASMYQKITGQQ